MKLKLFLAMMALLLTMSLLFTACANDPVDGENSDSVTDTENDTTPDTDPDDEQNPPEGGDDEQNPPEGGDDEQNPPDDDQPYTVKENYLPEAVSSAIKSGLENKTTSFSAFNMNNAPYAYHDVYTLSNCRVLSVTIPVMQTGEIDADGNLSFTLYKVRNTYEGIKSTPTKSYIIRVKAADYGLTSFQKNVNKVIKLDLSDRDIVLASDETLAFSSAYDSIIPAYLPEDASNKNVILNAYKTLCPESTGIFGGVGSKYSTSKATICFDVELERTYETKADYDAIAAEEEAYQKLVSELREKYKGKFVSILGDSISTFNGISDNASSNITIGSNVPYYPNADTYVYNYKYTYWGRLINDLGMNLCVNNSWSSSRVYGRTKDGNEVNDGMSLRATELDNDNGTVNDSTDDIAPDVILVYMGINDLQNDSPFGDLLTILNTEDGRTENEKIAAWFATVLAQAEAVGNTTTRGQSYKTFDQAYALGLNSMKNKYQNAEIYCMTLVQTYDTARCNAEQIEEYNRVITALAEYFGATVIDQDESGRTFDTVHAYSTPGDGHCIHPSSKGHELMERNIVETMYKKNKAN
ncbi:MAG: hypothetical protein IJ011_08330 [Clostridia bacterium]|nr:hypothetical protein [Clostridia bacterium]